MTLDADSSSEGPGFKENFAQIGVYFQSLNTKLVQEEPKYTVSIDSVHFHTVYCYLCYLSGIKLNK